MQSILLTFPSFNLFSMPLLLLTLQGYIFALLLLGRYNKEKRLSDLFLAILLILTGFRCTGYTIGFMDWYDTYRNTKINYFLLNITPSLGPLVYFYVRSLTQPYFKFEKLHWWHFAYQGIVTIYRAVLWVHDSQQPGFDQVQNGEWLVNIGFAYIGHFIDILDNISQIVYYAFSVQLFWYYRQRIVQFFSNTSKIELNWIRSFLLLYIGLYLFRLGMTRADELGADWHWQQKWWWYFTASLVMVYVGMKAYFTRLHILDKLSAPVISFEDSAPPNIVEEKVVDTSHELSSNKTQELLQYIENQKPYLNADLTLSDLAQQLESNANTLSHMINHDIGKNFNDFINYYRVEEVKEALQQGKQENMSLLGIALDAGFNSKATFNRAFKKITGLSPSAYINSI